MALPSSTTTTGSYQYYLNSMMPDHYSNQVMMQDAYAARLRASMNCSFSQALLNGPNPAGAAWQPNWPTNPICSNPASSEAYSGRPQLSNSGTAGSAFSPPGSSLEKFGEITASYYHQLRASLNARQALKQDSARSAHGQCSAPSYPQFADGTQNLASMDRVLQRKPNEHIKPDSVDLIRELSNRLACDSNGSSLGPSLASNLARCLQLGMQQNGPLPGAWANSNSVLNTGDVPVEQSCPGTGTSYDCVAHYLFDPGFAERAAKFSSLSSMINSPPTEDNDMPSFRHSLGEINPLKFHRSSSSPSQGLASPLADSIPRRTVSFAMGSADAKSSAKQELSEDSFQTGDQANGDAHKASASAASQRRERLQQCEQARGLEESSSGTFTVDSSGHNATKNSSQSKKRRIENEDNISSGAGRDPKIADSTLDCAANKGRSPFTIEKGLQEDRQAEEEKGTGKNSGKASQKLAKDKTHFNEPPKQDFIHVRARRGQATDSHSLAERVRREKISERMRFLQDLVPGCNKITGKAMMLDEIINYVQSLQHQVEFLSMKLAALNPQLDFNIENFFAGEVLSGMMFPNEVSEAVTGTTVTSGDLPYQMLHSSLTLRDAGSVDIPSSSHGIPTDATMDGSTSYCSALRSVAATNAFSQAANTAWDVDLQSLERRDIEYEGRRLFTPNTDQIDRLMEIESVKVEL